MIYVGKFTKEQCAKQEDKNAVEEKRKSFPDHKYTKADIRKRKGVEYLEVHIATLNEYLSGNW